MIEKFLECLRLPEEYQRDCVLYVLYASGNQNAYCKKFFEMPNSDEFEFVFGFFFNANEETIQ